jgi:D-glycero-D-manno-heptose 1,7-bisphosphate phosphatase
VIRRREDGNWEKINAGPTPQARPCLFLDRDGCLIEEKDYLCDPEQVFLILGAAEVIRSARDHGWAVAVVTNQSGIGRGRFDWDAYEAVERRVEEKLKAQGAVVDAVFACPYIEKGGLPPYDRDDSWRKPGPGMLLEAARTLNVDLAQSIMAGDKLADLEAGAAAGLRLVAHVRTGHGAKERSSVPDHVGFARVLKLESVADLRGQFDLSREAGAEIGAAR